MFQKFVQNLVGGNQRKQTTFPQFMIQKKRDIPLQQMPQMQIRKIKSADSDVPRLLVSIWQTESTYQMFDYQNKGVKTSEYKIENSNDIYMANVEKRNLKCILTTRSIPNDNIYCGTVDRVKGVHYFTPGTRLESFKVLARDSQDHCYLRAGDLIRIGRMKYFIKETFNGYETKSKQFERNQKTKTLNLRSQKQGTCKFCLCGEEDNSDLLISPCSCKGSCAKVHIQCLKQWLSNKVSRKSTSHVDFLNYDNFSCQLCKDELPIQMKIDGKQYNMLAETKTPTSPYLTLQGIPNKKSSTKNNMSIKIFFKESKKLIIGRGHESDIRLEDVSISRQHCFIKLTSSGKFQLIDNNSKFGTLIKLEPGNKVSLNQNKIQIARMTLEIVENQSKRYDRKYSYIDANQ